jgi:hypothetical protein
MKISTFENFTPFFMKTAAIGKAPYKGPAAAAPRRKESTIPLIPDSSPRCQIILSLGIHTSRRPNRINIGGITDNISRKLDPVMLKALRPS